MPSKWSFSVQPIADLLNRYVGDGKGWIDPFAGMYSPAEYRNDINSDVQHPGETGFSQEDALIYLTAARTAKYVGGLLDPPYSTEQFKRSYKMKHKGTAGLMEYLTLCKREMARIIVPGGVSITLGWSSNGLGIKNGFMIEEILLVAHGSLHNDTIVTVERKIQPRLGLGFDLTQYEKEELNAQT
jgi:hypothetical protein